MLFQAGSQQKATVYLPAYVIEMQPVNWHRYVNY